jgi:Flp pilus assembly protein protease CpaA
VNLLSGITDGKSAVIQWGVVIAASLIAAGCDIRTRRITNSLTFPLLVTGLIWAVWVGGLASLAEAAGACILLALPYILLFIFAQGGAGDAKLMAAIGAWLGLKQGVIVLCCVAGAGIVLGVIKAIIQKQAKTVLTSVFVSMYTFVLSLAGCKTMQFTDNLNEADQSNGLDIPYGVAIFAGVCAGGAIIWFM